MNPKKNRCFVNLGNESETIEETKNVVRRTRGITHAVKETKVNKATMFQHQHEYRCVWTDTTNSSNGSRHLHSDTKNWSHVWASRYTCEKWFDTDTSLVDYCRAAWNLTEEEPPDLRDFCSWEGEIESSASSEAIGFLSEYFPKTPTIYRVQFKKQEKKYIGLFWCHNFFYSSSWNWDFSQQ